jgi:hypothetical protein
LFLDDANGDLIEALGDIIGVDRLPTRALTVRLLAKMWRLKMSGPGPEG